MRRRAVPDGFVRRPSGLWVPSCGRRVAGLGGRHTGAQITRPGSSMAISGGGGGGAGSVSTFTALSRDAGSAAGGASVVATCTGVTGTPEVTVNGVSATVTGTTSTSVTFTIPAYAGSAAVGGTLVDVVIGGVTLSNGLEYHPAATITHISHNFEDGTLGGFSTNIATGTVAASTAYAYAGSKSCKCAVTGSYSGSGACLAYNFAGAHSNPAVEDSQGLYQRWYQLFPAATLTDVNTVSNQMKIHLLRVGGTQSVYDGHMMFGVGSDFPPGSSAIAAYDDATTGGNGPTNVQIGTFVADTWVEIQMYLRRTGGVGSVKIWRDGKLKLNGSYSRIGANDTAAAYSSWIGAVYTETTGNVETYLDNVALKDGFVDP